MDIGENLLGDKGAKEMQAYFQRNKTIEVLDVGYNLLKREGMRRIKEIIRVNTNVKLIVFKGNIDVDRNIEMCERR